MLTIGEVRVRCATVVCFFQICQKPNKLLTDRSIAWHCSAGSKALEVLVRTMLLRTFGIGVWSESKNFLAHLGLDFYGSSAKPYTAFGTITAQFVEKKSGTAGQFSMIGIYGWTQSPCVEWYINEDAYNGLYGGGSVAATIDGGTYSLSSTTTTGTEGANACESGHTGPWTQMKSTRKTARQCGTVTVSDHFAAWEQQGWTLGKLTMVHINVEVGGGTGSIDFPVANVTTTSK